MRRKFIVLPLFAALLLLVAFGTGMRCIVATATHVTDANSFDATADHVWGWGGDSPVNPGDEYHVRLMDIKAPTGSECYAQEATDYLTNLIEGKRVCLARDIGSHDSSGQLLAYVAVSSDSSAMGCDVFVNAEMVSKGYARTAADARGTPLRWLLNFLQCQAYQEKLGMWGDCPDLPPPTGCMAHLTPQPHSTGTPPAHSTGTPCAHSTATPTPDSTGTPESESTRHRR